MNDKRLGLFVTPRTCRSKIQHNTTTRSNVLSFPLITLSNPGPARKNAKKNIVMGICIHYTYVQTYTFDTTTPAPASLFLFLSRAFLLQIMHEPRPLSNQNPGCSMLGLTFYYERYIMNADKNHRVINQPLYIRSTTTIPTIPSMPPAAKALLAALGFAERGVGVAVLLALIGLAVV